MKKVFLGLTLVITLILPVGTNALDLTKSFETITASNDIGEVILPSYDNSGNVDGHYLYGNKLYKYNLNNELVYEKEDFEDEQIQLETVYKADNSNIKGNSDVKISSNNFEILYGGTGDEYLVDTVFKSYDDNGNHDGYIVFLLTTSTDIPGVTPGYIMIKINLNGKVLWQKNTNESHIIYSIFFAKNLYVKDKLGKEYIYVRDGYTIKKYNYMDDINTTDPIKTTNYYLDVTGTIYSYDKTGNIDGLILIGISASDKMTLVKYDLDLNEKFTYTSDELGLFYGVTNSKNEKGIYDGYIAVGITPDDDNLSGVIKKIDFSGNEVWQDTYKESPGGNYLIAITENYNEYGKYTGYAITGLINNEEQQFLTFLKYSYPGYKITNQESNEGNITVNTEAYPGEIVKVKVSPSVGYSLKRIVVMTSSGKEVEVDSNGTFVMPDEEVTVLALYNKVSNPSTLSACYIVLGIVLLISLGTLIVTKKKEI